MNNECEHQFRYPFISCLKCGRQLLAGDYTVAQVMGDWRVFECSTDKLDIKKEDKYE